MGVLALLAFVVGVMGFVLISLRNDVIGGLQHGGLDSLCPRQGLFGAGLDLLEGACVATGSLCVESHHDFCVIYGV
jgi:hypothetical protein